MIQLTVREDVLHNCPALARYMADWQQAEYEDMQDSGTAEETDSLLQKMDIIDIAAYPHPQMDELVYKIDAENIYEYTQKLPEALFQLAALCRWKELSFLLLYKNSWLHQQNAYPPVATELKYLNSIGVTNDYIGGITTSGIDMQRIIKTVFWLSRCNGSLPYIHFSAVGGHTVIYICKNGFLHFYSYSEEELSTIKSACSEAGLSIFSGPTSDYLEGGAYIGRQVITA